MKVLIVCSGNSRDERFSFEINQAFVHEQMQALMKAGIEMDLFLIKGRGMRGYLGSLNLLKRQLKNSNYDFIHAHYGLSGLVAIFQRHRPVVTTFHGSDINTLKLNLISSLVSMLSTHCIFVNKKLYRKIFFKPAKKYSVIPCGIDLETFYTIDQKEARKKLNFSEDEKIILFSSSFDNQVKNYPLAKAATEKINGVTLIELKNKKREEVNLLLNACDLLLMTSFSEGSPQVIKEAMACNCPIVSTDVGDVREIIGNTEGCYLSSFDANDVAEKIRQALNFGKRTDGRGKITHLDNRNIAKRILESYHKLQNH